MAKLTVQNTTDGSQTLYSEKFNETYHSVNGAVTESMHVFIDAGMKVSMHKKLQIFEVGFGTGLNAFLTLIEARKQYIHVNYYSIELYPIPQDVFETLNYADLLESDKALFKAMHTTPWNTSVQIAPDFELTKINADLLIYSHSSMYDLVYFDAFSPAIQPDLWSEEVFEKLYEHMNNEGILTTYCAKGSVRRTLQKVGFKTERLPGPPGKREMLRAVKLI